MSISHDSDDFEVVAFLRSLDCPRAVTVCMLYLSGEHDQLTELSFDPFAYADCDLARRSLCATSFLAKAKFLKTSFDRKARALTKFLEAEEQCAATNRKILRSTYDYKYTPTILSIAARKIERILGRVDAHEFADACGFGPGASTSLPRRRSSQPNKYALSKDISLEAFSFIEPWFHEAYPIMGDYMFSVGAIAEITTVPKNSKTDRTIAIEPDWNSFLQKGVGAMIRRRLRYWGIDLNDQSKNQELARIGSVDGSLATIDFSAASDTVAMQLVEELLPLPWLTLIKAFRSSQARMEDGTVVNLHKVSSMGNGYTFELESLIFFALASACADHAGLEGAILGVFGDDVIIPCSLRAMYESVTKDLGFNFNEAKSFSSSNFRESCGSYFWNGSDIKPIFLKEVLDTPQEYTKIANAIRLFSTRGNEHSCDHRYHFVWAACAKKGLPFRVPLGLGDVGVVVNFDELRPADFRFIRKLPHGHEGWSVMTQSEKFLETYNASRGLLISRLRTIGCGDEPLWLCNRAPTVEPAGFLRQKVAVPRWVDIGRWH